jgi:hypothetical protein
MKFLPQEPQNFCRGRLALKADRNGSALIRRLEFFAEMGRAGDFSAAALLVAFNLLYRHMNGTTGRCDPARATLAEETALSEASVKRAIRELEQSGWWHIVGRSRGAGRGHTNSYRPNYEKGVSPDPFSDDQNGSDPTLFKTGKWVRSDPENGSDPTPEPIKNQEEDSHRARVSFLFERFFGIFPSRGEWPNPQKPARAEFEAALEAGADPETIIAGAERYAAHVAKERLDSRYVKQAWRWLKDQEWTDRPRPVEASPKRYGRGLF